MKGLLVTPLKWLLMGIWLGVVYAAAGAYYLRGVRRITKAMRQAEAAEAAVIRPAFAHK